MQRTNKKKKKKYSAKHLHDIKLLDQNKCDPGEFAVPEVYASLNLKFSNKETKYKALERKIVESNTVMRATAAIASDIVILHQGSNNFDE